ncbi:hypothetical protein NUW58_g4237 [Xylaria curta]|uniref:Uncharacterized protein n=1 Tax=Xylaria curta TaxID=42375 RepID=A0ACC1P8X8_9PEZI|nr:hypothetical protein NUW58_g4237 [Xylaria curta]
MDHQQLEQLIQRMDAVIDAINKGESIDKLEVEMYNALPEVALTRINNAGVDNVSPTPNYDIYEDVKEHLKRSLAVSQQSGLDSPRKGYRLRVRTNMSKDRRALRSKAMANLHSKLQHLTSDIEAEKRFNTWTRPKRWDAPKGTQPTSSLPYRRPFRSTASRVNYGESSDDEVKVRGRESGYKRGGSMGVLMGKDEDENEYKANSDNEDIASNTSSDSSSNNDQPLAEALDWDPIEDMDLQ